MRAAVGAGVQRAVVRRRGVDRQVEPVAGRRMSSREAAQRRQAAPLSRQVAPPSSEASSREAAGAPDAGEDREARGRPPPGKVTDSTLGVTPATVAAPGVVAALPRAAAVGRAHDPAPVGGQHALAVEPTRGVRPVSASGTGDLIVSHWPWTRPRSSLARAQEGRAWGRCPSAPGGPTATGDGDDRGDDTRRFHRIRPGLLGHSSAAARSPSSVSRFQQPPDERVEQLAVVLDRRAGLLLGVVEQAPDLGVEVLVGALGQRRRGRAATPRYSSASDASSRTRPMALAHAVAADDLARQAGGVLDVLLRAGRASPRTSSSAASPPNATTSCAVRSRR